MATYPRDERRANELETFAKKVAIALGFLAVIALLWAVREVLLLIFIAAVLAAGIAPAVHRVRVYGRYYLHRNVNRGTAVMLVYFPFLAVVLTLLLVLVPRLMRDWQMLGAQMPVLIDRNILQPLDRYISMKPVRDALHQGITVERSTMIVYVKNVAAAVAGVIAVFFMVAYMLIDATRLRNLILLFYPAEKRGDKRAMLNRMANRMTSWLAGQMILAAIVGVATFFFLLLLRLPYALPLAILATFGEMVPIIGPILGTTPALAVALLYSKWQFWSMLVFALLLQKFENLFIAPKVMSNKVKVSPLAVFIAFMIGGSLLGIVGAILAVPVAAIIQVAFDETFVSRRERRQDVDRAGTLLRRVD